LVDEDLIRGTSDDLEHRLDLLSGVKDRAPFKRCSLLRTRAVTISPGCEEREAIVVMSSIISEIP
jgi:hypothetical protein